MRHFKTLTALIIVSIFSIKTFGQSNFSKGFDRGFKEGFCYNKSVGCLPPLTPLTPLTRIGESDNSYQDGYNRGFQVGLDLQRLQGGTTTSTYSNPNYYRSIPRYTPSEYIPPVDLQLLASVLERKQRLFDSRAEWIQNRIDKISDMAVILLQQFAPNDYTRITNSLTNFINQQLNSQPLDFTDNSLFNQIVSIMNQYERQIYSVYSNALSEINTVTIPTNFAKTYTNGSCSFKASNSRIVSYAITDNNGKKLSLSDYETFNLKTEAIDVIPSVKIYYVFSKTDNNYYSVVEDKITEASQSNTSQKMKFMFSSEAFFMLANFQGSFWIFDRGISKSGSLTNLGDKVFKTSSGKMEVFRVYQDRYSLKKYYIPKDVFTNGTVNEEYPIYSN